MKRSKRNLHTLAMNLGMTVRELKSKLTISEYVDWLRYYGEKEDDSVQLETAEDMVKAWGAI